MKPVSSGKAKKTNADAEADGLKTPDPIEGKRMGVSWAQKLKRVFNIEVSIRSDCGRRAKVVRPGRPHEDCVSRIIAGIPDQSIEDPLVISKILAHLEDRCRSQALVNRRPGAGASNGGWPSIWQPFY